MLCMNLCHVVAVVADQRYICNTGDLLQIIDKRCFRTGKSNLNRQFFFRDQLGLKKVDALSENLRRIEPDLDLVLHDVRLTPVNARPTFENCQIIVEALDSADAKSMLLGALLPMGKPIVSASGLAGWGRSRTIGQRRIGKNLILIGDTTSDIRNGLAPVSPRVGIAAAMEANAVVALLLDKEI